jgi:hypothetical protein
MVTFLKDSFKGYDGRLNKNKRRLPERSHLTLEFPQKDDRVLRTFVPFMENPQISEKGRANLNSYNLVGRAGQLFSYAGADSRKLSVTFNISLLHVIEMASDEGIDPMFTRQFQFFFTDREQAKGLFNLKQEISLEREAEALGLQSAEFTEQQVESLNNKLNEQLGPKEGDLQIRDKDGFGRDHARLNREYYRKVAGIITGQPLNFDAEAFVDSLLPFTVQEDPNEASKLKSLNDSIDLVYLWLNLIRATVLNRSDNTAYGPPIVRLTHGAMYNNVPCLVEDYSISIIEDRGYDVETLTPKGIQIVLQLVESRTGDFGNYAGGRVVTGDNLTGWESIIINNELDPYNGIVAQEGDLNAL